MIAKVHSSSVKGVDAHPITVEVDISNGLPAVVIVGLPDASKESKDKIKGANIHAALMLDNDAKTQYTLEP